MRRSVLLDTPELEKPPPKHSSQIPEQFDLRDGRHPADSIHSQMSQDQRVSAILRDNGNGSKHSQKDSSSTHKSTTNGHTPSGENPRRPSSNYSNRLALGPEDSSPEDSTPEHSVTRADIRASAEKILYTFLLSGSEREIILPPIILSDITVAIEEQGRDDPELFDAAKEYVFQAMERDAFPGFLRSKALGNLVPPSLMLRLIVGLLAVFGGFWAAFILVFINASRARRCWVRRSSLLST